MMTTRRCDVVVLNRISFLHVHSPRNSNPSSSSFPASIVCFFHYRSPLFLFHHPVLWDDDNDYGDDEREQRRFERECMWTFATTYGGKSVS